MKVCHLEVLYFLRKPVSLGVNVSLRSTEVIRKKMVLAYSVRQTSYMSDSVVSFLVERIVFFFLA